MLIKCEFPLSVAQSFGEKRASKIIFEVEQVISLRKQTTLCLVFMNPLKFCNCNFTQKIWMQNIYIILLFRRRTEENCYVIRHEKLEETDIIPDFSFFWHLFSNQLFCLKKPINNSFSLFHPYVMMIRPCVKFPQF